MEKLLAAVALNDKSVGRNSIFTGFSREHEMLFIDNEGQLFGAWLATGGLVINEAPFQE